jgi:predicted nicotinamide N-methyase
VLDYASGSGLCALAAAQAGAASVTAVDIDPLAAAAIPLNARANGLRVAAVQRDLLDDDPPDVDVILAGDVCYEAGFAAHVIPWLRRSAAAGVEILIGDPGRRYLPVGDLVELADYEVRTTTELEDLERKRGWVYALGPTTRPA